MRLPGLLAAAAFALALVLQSGHAAKAGNLPMPTGPVLLTMSGAITGANDGDMATFDRAMLEALPQTEFTTETIWTEGPHVFTGVELQALLAAVGAKGTSVRATALNDYSVEIPVSDAVPGGPVVAILMDGSEMSPRDKGPLWIVYPYDSDSAYRTEVIYSRSIWQLVGIEVVD